MANMQSVDDAVPRDDDVVLADRPRASDSPCWWHVGARWRAAIWLVSLRFASSGNGELMSPERRPASRWITGICRLKAATAALMTVDVSP